eukprot:4618486-Pyramimonas_sp.AAC.1
MWPPIAASLPAAWRGWATIERERNGGGPRRERGAEIGGLRPTQCSMEARRSTQLDAVTRRGG